MMRRRRDPDPHSQGDGGPVTAHLGLVTWNCKGMGRRNVLSVLDQFRPDILVIPEYANAEDGCDPPEGYSRVSVQWKGYRPLAVLAAAGWTLHQPGLPPL